MPERITHPDDVAKPAPSDSASDSRVVTDPAELARRRLLIARANGQLAPEDAATAQRAELEARARRAQEAWAASRPVERQRARPAMAHEFDPGPMRARWAREGEGGQARARSGDGIDRGPEAVSASMGPGAARDSSTSTTATPRVSALTQHDTAPAERKPRRRGWKLPAKRARVRGRREKRAAERAAALQFGTEKAWTPARKQRLAERTKRNERVIAHPSSAEAALKRLSIWAQASVRRALRAKGWTLGDEAARRHVAWWATMEEFARLRAWQRPRPRTTAGGMQRFAGIPRYAYAVVGWTQTALAIALSGASYTAVGDDPIDVKTVQRHTDLAREFGGVQLVARDPSAPPELRGAPTAANPRGWAINVYWIPSSPEFHKPGFTGRWIDASGQPIDMDEALQIELIARAKRPRRLRDAARAARAAERPPPL